MPSLRHNRQTAPLIQYYRDKELLKEINGSQSMDKVLQDICVILGRE